MFQPLFVLLFIIAFAQFPTKILAFQSETKTSKSDATNNQTNSSDSSSTNELSGVYKITAKHSGKAVDVAGISLENGARVYQWGYWGGDNQQWQIVAVGDGFYKLLAKHSNKALDATAPFENGTIVHQWDYWGGDNQKWRIEPLDDGYYRIVSKQNGKVLDVAGASMENGGGLIQYDWHGGDNQRWRLEQIGSAQPPQPPPPAPTPTPTPQPTPPQPEPSPTPTPVIPPSPTPTPQPTPVPPINQLSDRVLIVYNANSQDSTGVARYYAAKRSIPFANLCSIAPSDTYGLDWNQYVEQVRTPVQNCLNALGRERILYIVFSYQTPFRMWNVPVSERNPNRYLVNGTGGSDDGGFISIDQHVAAMWEPTPSVNHGYSANALTQQNYYQPFQSLADYRSQANAPVIYSVWRLDAKNADLAKQLVDRALEGERVGLRGQACFDRNRGQFFPLSSGDSGYLTGDWDLYRAAQFAREKGFNVLEDGNEQEFGQSPAPLRCDNAALYSGWYSLNNYNDAFSWAPGAIGFHLDSASAVDPRGGNNWSANAVEKGIAVTAGAITEPYLQYLPHPDGVFRNLFEGANVGDAFLRNVPALRWRIIQIGDPLYRPFPSSTFPVAKTALPSPWKNRDVSAIPLSGTSQITDRGTIIVTGGGDQFWYDRDKFQFSYQKLNGDGEIVARVLQCENASWDSKAGVMIRESVAENSRYISLSTGCGKRNSQLRAEANGGTTVLREEQIDQKTEWLKIVRSGNLITGYASVDGQNWNQFVQQQLSLSSPALIGLFSYADSNSYQNQAMFDQVSVRGSVEPVFDNTPPSIEIVGVQQQANTALVTINAQDAESGVKNIYYSLDGVNYALYTGAFTVNYSQNTVTVRTFAEDNADNRSRISFRSFGRNTQPPPGESSSRTSNTLK